MLSERLGASCISGGLAVTIFTSNADAWRRSYLEYPLATSRILRNYAIFKIIYSGQYALTELKEKTRE